MVMNVSPAMLAMMALEKPELLAQMAAAKGIKPPSSGRPQLLPGEQGGPPAPTPAPQPQAAPAQPQAVAPQMSPMPQPTPIAPIPMPPAAALPAQTPVQTAAAPAPVPSGGVQQPTASPTQSTGDFANAMAALSVPQNAGGDGTGRVGTAPSPFQGSALSPATLQILQQLLQPQAAPASLGALMGGGR